MAAAAIAANKTNQAVVVAAAASDRSDNAAMPAAKQLVDPQLLMAARRGNSKRIKELLRLNDGIEEEVESRGNNGSNGGGGVESAAAADAVILEVAPDADGPPAAVAAATPPPFQQLVDDDGVTLEGDTLLHVVAACGNDGEDFLDCAKMIVRDKKRKGGAAAVRLALEARNRKGDTPLHCAAGAGNANMIGCLIDLIADHDEAGAAVKKAFLRLQNECGETALHQAVRAINNKAACIDRLMAVDSELACIPSYEGGGASTLGDMEIAWHLYAKSKGNLSCSGPHGRNVLHAAVSRGQGLPMILEWLKDVKTTSGGSSVAAAQPDLLSQLTSQRDRQQKGSTPLHLAASLYHWELMTQAPVILQFPRFWPPSVETTAMLLDANESTAYQADDEGSYPIHVAARSGNVGDVKILLKRCPDCATLRDGKGRTFLHVATEGKRLHAVRYVCGEMPQQLSSMILNAQDSNGETALHGAVRGGNVPVFNCLFRSRKVRLDVANQDRMTPLDLSWSMIPDEFQYELNPRSIVHNSLHAAGAPNGGGRPEVFYDKHIRKADLVEESKKYTEATQVMSIVTALTATVTFAAAFTLPGGYRPDNGEPVLAGSYAFDAFILADTLAFICSISATCTLVYAGFPGVDIHLRDRYLFVSMVLLRSAHIHLRDRYLFVSMVLLRSAARSLVAAFGLGLYLVVHHTASAIAACAIVFASSLYGNMEVWPLIRMATTVVTRIGNRRRAVVVALVNMLGLVLLLHFWSYVIIFSFPAIRKWAH